MESVQVEETGSSSAEANPSVAAAVDVEIEALEKLNAGKRNLACDEYPQAVDTLAAACELLASKYTEEGNELAEAYYYYGKALLELARMENGVLGNALNGVTTENENEADLSESDQFEKAGQIKERIDASAGKVEKESAEKVDEEKFTDDKNTAAEEDMQEGDAEKVNDSGEADAAGDDSGEGDAEVDEGENIESPEEEATSSQDEEDNPDDIPNLQLSWEVLEMAKRIYSKKAEEEEGCDKSVKIRLSEVYRCLGEVSLETGAIDQAVQDMMSCLEIQTECMESDSRLMAEIHYQLGNAHLLAKTYPSAVEELCKAKEIIENRITNLGKQKTETEDKTVSGRLDKELSELKQLLPDIIAKVEDAEDEARNAEKALAEMKAAMSSSGTTTIGFGSADEKVTATTIPVKKANDISNLVRKRKPEESAGNEGLKRSKPEMNGAGDKENGQVEIAAADVTTSEVVDGH